MPKRKISAPVRPNVAARVAALGFGGRDIPRPFVEDADFVAPNFRAGVEQDDAPQDYAEFAADKNRNLVTASRRTLVIVPVGVSLATRALAPHSLDGLALPAIADVASYLSAFTGLPTRIVAELPIENWTGGGRGRKAVAVRTSKSLVKVRVKKTDGEFQETLEVSDILDALLEELPKDAYAIVGLTPFDICEDEAIIGGRAYGGSRIACLSYARYHPAFDDISRDWPLGLRAGAGGPITAAARAAAAALPRPSGTDLWLERVITQVSSHEVGHCLGLDHCTMYNCWMGENEGQAPYACPVCLRKLFDTTGAARGASDAGRAALPAARTHYRALMNFCSSRLQVQKWAAMHAWCSGRLAQLEAVTEEEGAGGGAMSGANATGATSGARASGATSGAGATGWTFPSE